VTYTRGRRVAVPDRGGRYETKRLAIELRAWHGRHSIGLFA
jgi:hypothetical protein